MCSCGLAVKPVEKNKDILSIVIEDQKIMTTLLCYLAFITVSSKNMASVLWLFRICPLQNIFVQYIFQNLPSVYYYLCLFFASKCHLFNLRIVLWGASIMYEGGVFGMCYS